MKQENNLIRQLIVKPAFKQFIRFVIVGVSNTMVTLLSFYLLHEIFQIKYLYASIAGYVLGIINSYLGNKFWTFKVLKSPVKKELGKFISVNLTGLLLNTLFISGFVEILNFKPFIAQIFTVCFIVLFSFTANKFWVFKQKSV